MQVLPTHLKSIKSSSSWVVGIFDQTKRAVLTGYESEQCARRAYNENPHASRVLLFRTESSSSTTTTAYSYHGTDGSDVVTTFHKLISCSTATWDVHGIGVATLLRGDTTVPEIEIQRHLADGSLPFVPPQRSLMTQYFLIWAMKLVYGRTAVTHFGSAPHRYQSVCHFDLPPVVKCGGTKYVALSLDDAPCRFNDRDCSMVSTIQDKLAQYDAKATFMLVGQWCTAHHKADLISLLRNGHELGNHGMLDRSYEYDDPEIFGQAVDQCTDTIQNLQREAGLEPTIPWFRAPHGRYTAAMAEQLQQRHMVNVMCDTYASCPAVQDGAAIAEQLLQMVHHGSIILLHMPEVHVRQWCWTALDLLLAGLTEQGYRVRTIGQLAQISKGMNNSTATGQRNVISNNRRDDAGIIDTKGLHT